jgi:hypothetical protein
MSKQKTNDKFEYGHITSMTDAVSIVSKYMGRSGAMVAPSGKGENYSPDFLTFWFCEKAQNDLVVLKWHKQSVKVQILSWSLYEARFEAEKPISQKAYEAIEANLYQLAGELVAAGYEVDFE